LISLSFIITQLYSYEVGTIFYQGPSNMSGNNITFGMPVTLDGTSSSYLKMGPILKNTMDMWVWWVNTQYGGIKIGDEVYLVRVKYINDWHDSEHVTNITEYLIDKEESQLMFAPYSTTLTKYASAVTEDKGVILLGASASASSIYVGKKYLFSPLTSSGALMKAGIKTLVLRGAETIVKVVQARTFTQSMCSTLDTDYMTELTANSEGQVRIVYETELSESPTDAELDSLLWNLTHLVTEHVDISIGCVYYDVCTTMIQKAKEYNYEPDAMIFSVCVDNSNFVTDVGRDDGRYVLGSVLWHEDMVLTGDVTGWSAKDYADMYRLRYSNVTPPYQSASYFAGGVALLKAIENAASLDSDDIAYALSRLDIDTFFGTINFDSLNQGSSDFSYIQYDENGDLKVVIPDSVATGSLIHPMPSWSYRECISTHGEDSCMCSEEGCPECTLSDYNYTVTQCIPSISARWVVYSLISDGCVNGTALPDPVGLECDHVPFGSSHAVILQVLGYLGLAVGMFFLSWTVIFRKANVVKASQPLFCYLIAAGGMICAVSPVATLGKNTDANCGLRPWIFHVPFLLMVGSLFVKTFRVWRIFGNAKLVKVKFTVLDSLKMLGAVIFVPIAVLAIWFIVYTPIALDSTISVTNVGSVPATTCRTFDMFTTILVVYEVGIIVLACYFSFKNRKIGDAFSETKYLIFAIYSIALIQGITNLVAAMDVPYAVKILMRGVGTSLSCTISICTIFIPKIIMYFAIDDKEVFATAGGGIKVGTLENGTQNEGDRVGARIIHVSKNHNNEFHDNQDQSSELVKKMQSLIDMLNSKLEEKERITFEQYCSLESAVKG